MSSGHERTSLLLVRHGESTWNAMRRWQGQADPPLTEQGEQQARAAATALAGHGPFDVVVTSHLQRARRTGELLAEHASLSLTTADPDLAERAAGAWEGLTRVEIDEQWPGYLADGLRPPGYEHDGVVVVRALAALGRIVADHRGGRVVVVSHGGVINALERHVMGDLDHTTWDRLDNLEGRWFLHRGDDSAGEGDDLLALSLDGVRVQLIDPNDSEPPHEHYA